MASSAQKPCLKAFSEAVDLPADVRAPVECWALRALASCCFCVDMFKLLFLVAGAPLRSRFCANWSSTVSNRVQGGMPELVAPAEAEWRKGGGFLVTDRREGG